MLLLLSALCCFAGALGESELLISKSTGVIQLNLETKSYRTIFEGARRTIVDLDYHQVRGIVVWIDGVSSQIRSRDLDGSTEEDRVLVEVKNVWEPVAVAVDFVSDKFYVVDRLGKTVDAFHLDGREYAIVLGTGLEDPIGIVLDPNVALMFVIDNDRILRMNMDGSEVYPVVRKTIELSISAIAIDRTSKSIFWYDSDLRTIESSGYIGDSRKIIYSSHAILEVSSLTYVNHQIFYLDKGSHTISKVDSDGNSQHKSEKIADNVSGSSVRAIEPHLQETEVPNPCEVANGGCQQFCLLSRERPGNSSVERSCACSVPNLLDDSGTLCNEARTFLLYTQKEVIKGSSLNPDSREIVTTIATRISLSRSIDFDYVNEYVYFTDSRSKTIYRHDIKRATREAIVGYEGGANIAMDWAAQNLYYTDFVEGTLSVVSLKNPSYHKILLNGLSEPRDIIVHSKKGQIYFYENNHIKRINADGTKLATIYKPMIHRTLKLALDFAEERLYWSMNDLENISLNSTIQHAHLNGSDVRTINVLRLRDVSALAVHGDWIYLICERFEKLLRLNKRTGKQLTEMLPRYKQGFYALAVFSDDRQSKDLSLQPHPCLGNNGGCSHLCFGVPWTKNRVSQNQRPLMRVCACPAGEHLRKDRKTCQDDWEGKARKLVHQCEPDWEFTCQNRRCIPKTQVCDGVIDCLDRSDERRCAKDNRDFFGG